MKKIVVFGKPAGGKSTFSKNLSVVTGIKLYHLDLIEYLKNGEKVESSKYLEAHNNIIKSDSWIIEGLGSMKSLKSRIMEADTLIYIDLSYKVAYWLVIKRFLKSLFIKPEGWPDGSSVFKGTLNGFKYLRLSPEFWTDEFVKKLEGISSNNILYRLSSIKEQNEFINEHTK